MNDDTLLKELFADATPAHIQAAMRAFNAPGVLVLGNHQVPSSNRAGHYTVRIFMGGPTQWCSCPSYIFERSLDKEGNCKHIRAVKYSPLPNNEWYVLKEDPRERPKENSS